MRIWRISNFDDLSGVGGLKADGRWHDRGRPVVYAADHPASALLEVMVHLEIDFEDLPTTYQLLGIDVPDDVAVETMNLTDIETMSRDWADDPRVTRGMLRPWFDAARTAIMSVPSVIVPFAQNYLINPRHRDAARIRVSHVGRYPHDLRLFGRRAGGD
ncbi:RES family NAD+ phosphorylase [Bradyrhizobium diazoefficiens]|nr:RES family NAD+ phosphorylase [Bradyrhizobium diazoefficiens]UCF50827.1 MAG: RES family NAD+ phosphorylase [Bradyrhizobium sp.]MBR0968911.1 RES family NAD+ phosphorylase [Bradyrhizobium diazoefficiens]MBR0975970.1 RES family NAD+ phosphorylase [Bradyrhizobium diazoefficiens]MBR1008740.1 RES family NAD+ phosphorylase [Bradyrhizobium diazoefficiens]MBR1015010.1 RES family NAD+ phosphorylase [Bradyrhizobium diazoefficiens]